MRPLVEPFLLANPAILGIYEAGKLGMVVSLSAMREHVFLEFHRPFGALPDHVFGGRWSRILKASPSGQITVDVLHGLAQQFFSDTPRMAVKLARFGDWQNLLSRISGLPVHASVLSARDAMPTKVDEATEWIRPAFQAGIFISPHEETIENFIAANGLNETHLHLNGTTPAEICWHRALLEPENELCKFAEKYNGDGGGKVAELCHAIDPGLTPELLMQRLRTASRIRAILIKKATERPGALSAENFPVLGEDVNTIGSVPLESSSLVDQFSLDAWLENCVIEVTWISLLLRQLRQHPDPIADKLLHHYLLIQNQYVQLTVQRDDLYGFDQFQKFTFTTLRDRAEVEYEARFWQLHGSADGPSRVNRFEGRFAPRNTHQENVERISSILRGYARYLFPEKSLSDLALSPFEDVLELLENAPRPPWPKMELALVAHFIKQEQISGEGYRHSELRGALKRQCDALVECIEKLPSLKRWLRGIDAAANELHAAPEVFAPLFRVAHQHGFQRRTYHAGEDFFHLLGGIRAIHETVSFLDLAHGDRIGHGTAIGILPERWLDSMPHVIVIKSGEWMLDLLFAWEKLRHQKKFSSQLEKIENELSKLAKSIFSAATPIPELHAAMSFRGLWPPFVFSALDDPHWTWEAGSLNDAWRNEARLVSQAMERHRPALEILARWWRDEDVVAASERYTEIEADFFSPRTLLKFQQDVMVTLVKLRITVETLPTSNVRISQYSHVRDHHVFRWMRTKASRVPADPELHVSLGSDDPGIFAVDIVSEIYHLYSVMTQDQNLGSAKAMKLLARLNACGYASSFHGDEEKRSTEGKVSKMIGRIRHFFFGARNHVTLNM